MDRGHLRKLARIIGTGLQSVNEPTAPRAAAGSMTEVIRR
jgi:hypothetical protein